MTDVQVLYTENYRLLLREIFKDLTKLIGIHEVFMDQKTQYY